MSMNALWTPASNTPKPPRPSRWDLFDRYEKKKLLEMLSEYWDLKGGRTLEVKCTDTMQREIRDNLRAWEEYEAALQRYGA